MKTRPHRLGSRPFASPAGPTPLAGHWRRAVQVLGLATSLALAWPSHAGPWTVGRGRTTVGLSSVSTGFDEVRLADRTSMKVTKVHFDSNALVLRHGLTDRLELSGSAPYESSWQVRTAGSSYDGLADGRIGVKYRAAREEAGDAISASIGAEVKTPLSDYPANRLSSVGDGQTDSELRLSLGRFREPGHLVSYGVLEGAYRWRNGDPSDEFVLFGEVGFALARQVTGRLFAERVDQLGGLGLMSAEFLARAARDGLPPFPAVEEDFTKAGAGLSFRTSGRTNLGLFYSGTVEASSTAIERSVGFYGVYDF